VSSWNIASASNGSTRNSNGSLFEVTFAVHFLSGFQFDRQARGSADSSLRRALLPLLIPMVIALVDTATPAAASDALEIQLSGHILPAPGALRVTIFVEKDDAHRWLRVVADSPQFFRSSVIQLDGARSPRTHYINYRNLPEGDYSIRVELQGARDTLAVEQQLATVVGEPLDSP
jgi:hypothetical protein